MKKSLLFSILFFFLFFTGFSQLDYQSVNKHLVGQNQRPPQDTIIPPLWIGEIRVMIKGDTSFIYVCVSKGLGKKWKLITSNFEVPVDTTGFYNRKSTKIAAHADYELWDSYPTRLYLFDSLTNKYNLIGPYDFRDGLVYDSLNQKVSIGGLTRMKFNTWTGMRYMSGSSTAQTTLFTDSLSYVHLQQIGLPGSGTGSYANTALWRVLGLGSTHRVTSVDNSTNSRSVFIRGFDHVYQLAATERLNMRTSKSANYASALNVFSFRPVRLPGTTPATTFAGGNTPYESPSLVLTMFDYNVTTDSLSRVVLKGWWAHHSTGFNTGTNVNARDSIEYMVDYLSGGGVDIGNRMKEHYSLFVNNEASGEKRWGWWIGGAGRKNFAQGKTILGEDSVDMGNFILQLKGKMYLKYADSTNIPMNMLTLNRTTGAVEVTSNPIFGVSGVSTLSSGTIVVNTSFVKSGSNIIVSHNTPSGTIGYLSVPSSSIVNGVSFTINSSSALDNSTVNWWIKN